MPTYFASGNLFIFHATQAIAICAALCTRSAARSIGAGDTVRVARQIRDRNVAADLVARLGAGMQGRLPLLANRSEFARAARVEDAAAGSTHGARDLTAEPCALPATAAAARHGRQQC